MFGDTCQRPGCKHPKEGFGREGHYHGPGLDGRPGEGPCRARGCTCPAFLIFPWKRARRKRAERADEGI